MMPQEAHCPFGQVIGTFLSPPCEAFSIGRHNQLADSTVVPVRSGSQPRGLTALTQRQCNQITIGSFLLFAALAFITLAVLIGNAAMVEHPAFLGRKHIDLDAASIWRLPEMLRVLRLPVGSLHLVYQADFGMKAIKPIHFGAWRLPTYERKRLQYRCPTPAAEFRSFQGRNADG